MTPTVIGSLLLERLWSRFRTPTAPPQPRIVTLAPEAAHQVFMTVLNAIRDDAGPHPTFVTLACNGEGEWSGYTAAETTDGIVWLFATGLLRALEHQDQLTDAARAKTQESLVDLIWGDHA